MSKSPKPPAHTGFTTREEFLGEWPISKRGNPWCRCGGFTWTIKTEELHDDTFALDVVVVGPGGERADQAVDFDNADDLRAALWPEGAPGPSLSYLQPEES